MFLHPASASLIISHRISTKQLVCFSFCNFILLCWGSSPFFLIVCFLMFWGVSFSCSCWAFRLDCCFSYERVALFPQMLEFLYSCSFSDFYMIYFGDNDMGLPSLYKWSNCRPFNYLDKTTKGLGSVNPDFRLSRWFCLVVKIMFCNYSFSATMTKIIKEMLPPDVRVARDAQDLLIECCVGENILLCDFLCIF